MALESSTYISELVDTNPTVSDPVGQGDDHLRMLKTVLKTQFRGLSGTTAVTTSESVDIENVSFNANIFKVVLHANKECESATFEVSSQGLSRITFKIDDYTSTYYLVSVQDVD